MNQPTNACIRNGPAESDTRIERSEEYEDGHEHEKTREHTEDASNETLGG